jgi:NitT/TauT family transport system ATP-binding protein
MKPASGGLGVVQPVDDDVAVRISGVSKTYADGHSAVQALDRVSFDVRSGEFLCLLGASGCGKSTLLNLIAGLYKLSDGDIDVGDRRVGLMFQDAGLFPWLTVAANIDMALRLRGVPRKQRAPKRDQLLSLVHLDGSQGKRPHELSGGMRQRVALARALAQEADVLLMDEPFGALDAITRDVLHEHLETIWRSTGLTTIFVTHNVREAVRLGDRIVLLSSRPGRVAAEFTVDIPRPRHMDSREVADQAGVIAERLREEVRRHGG